MTLKLESTTTWTQKRLKLGTVSSFDPHNMCAKVERIMKKTRCTSCTNWTISFKLQGFQTKTHLLQRHFIFLSLFKLKTFFHPTCNIQSDILKFQPFLTSFAIFHAFNDLFSAIIGKHYNLNSEKVETWHDPHNMCAKVERITTRTGCTSCTNWTISFKVQGFETKTDLLQRHFIFLSLFQLNTFFASNMQPSKPHTEISTLSDLIWYFSCL